MTRVEEKKLRIFKRKIIKIIFGVVKINEELGLQGRDIVREMNSM